MTANQIPVPEPPVLMPSPSPDRATPFGSVTPSAAHWPGSSEPLAGRAAARSLEFDGGAG